jgi:hypothetical protein
MAVSVDLDIVGIKDALAELNKIDKVARREITRDFRKITQFVIDDAKAKVPLNAPISGFKRNWTTRSGAQILPWDLSDNDDIFAGVSGKRPKMYGGFMQNVATFYIKYRGATSILFDMSGAGKVPTVQGSNMVSGLSRRYGRPSRVLWPAYEQNKEQVEEEVRKLVDKVMDYVNQGLAGAKARRIERQALKQAA